VTLACDTRNEPDRVAPSSDTITRIRFEGVSGDSSAGSITCSRGRFGLKLGEMMLWGDSIVQFVATAGGDGWAFSRGGGWALLGEISKAVGRFHLLVGDGRAIKRTYPTR